MKPYTLILCLALTLLGYSSQNQGEKAMKEVKDLYRNTIGLDEKNQVIMKDYRYKRGTIFKDEPEREYFSDKSFLEKEKLRATNLLNTTRQILDSSPLLYLYP